MIFVYLFGKLRPENLESQESKNVLVEALREVFSRDWKNVDRNDKILLVYYYYVLLKVMSTQHIDVIMKTLFVQHYYCSILLLLLTIFVTTLFKISSVTVILSNLNF